MSIRLSKAIGELNIGLQTAVEFLEKNSRLGEVIPIPSFKLNDEQYAALVEEFKGNKEIKKETARIFPEHQKEKKLEYESSTLVEKLPLKEKNQTNGNMDFKKMEVEHLGDDNIHQKQQIEKSYENLISNLENFSNTIERIDGINDAFDDIQDSFTKALNKKIDEAKVQLKSSLNETIWDNLVIAFFGETNAGKSTIIETFRILFDESREKEDGLIVGDGRHDFTKVYEEYHLSIEGNPFTLIDVPGIEGNESEFKEGIKKALHKAHCVFYVQGHNKKPDTATAAKIKQYLGDWVKVYSVYNVRGGSGNYDEEEEREILLTPNVRKTEELIKKTFKEILGNVYSGNITIQALLAMCAKAVFSSKREDLANTQRKLLKYFGTPKKILQFSQFQTIINIVNEKSQNFTSEIVEANKQKMISLANSVKADLNKVIEEQNENITKLKEHLRSFRNDSASIISTTKSNIKNKTKSKLDSSYAHLKTSIYEIIDNDSIEHKDAKIKREQATIGKRLIGGINQIITQEIENANTKIKKKRKELDGIVVQDSLNPNIQINFANINFEGAIDELDISIDDVLDWATKTAGGAMIGAPMGPIGAGVGALVGSIVHFLTGKDGKSEAKNQVSKAIEEDKKRVWKKLSINLEGIYKKLDHQSHSIKKTIDKELKNIDRIETIVTNIQRHVQEYANNINHSEYGTI